MDDPSAPYYFCTYFDRHYLTRGLALYESLCRHCRRPFVLWILCFDDETYATLRDLRLPEVRLITQAEFEAGDDELAAAKATRSAVEYYWTCTPSLPLYVLAQHAEVDAIAYLDADLFFFADPEPIYAEFQAGSILIIEHRYAPEHAHLAAESGVYNVGCLIFRRNAQGLACLREWRGQCIAWCYRRYEEGKFGDQLYLDAWPRTYSRTVVLQHPGAGLAPWNLARYRVDVQPGGITVEGQPLIFYHYHSFALPAHQVAALASAGYILPTAPAAALYLPYAEEVVRQSDRLGRPRRDSLLAPSLTLTEIAGAWSQEFYMLLEPKWLAQASLGVGAWLRENRTQVELGFLARSQGDAAAMRRHFLSAIRANPLVLRNLGIISLLVESVVGATWMNRYRARRRGLHEIGVAQESGQGG